MLESEHGALFDQGQIWQIQPINQAVRIGRKIAMTTESKQFEKKADYPTVGELWDCEGRVAIICGNSFSENGRMWIMEGLTGLRGNAKLNQLTVRDDRKSLSESNLINRFSEWARDGNPDAMWWLAWWFEGTNHHKSVWYYVAALRADPDGHGWAHERIMADARTGCMCEGTPEPDTSFIFQIPELQGNPIGSDWKAAVVQAEIAIHIPAKKANNQKRRVFCKAYSAPADTGSIS